MDCSPGSRRETMLQLNQAVEVPRRVLSTSTSPDPGAAGDAGSGLRCAEGMDDSSLEEEEDNPIPPQHRPKWCRAQPFRRTAPEEADDAVEEMLGIWASKDRSRLYMYQRNAIDDEQTSLRPFRTHPLYAQDVARFQTEPEGVDGLPPIPRYPFEDDLPTKSGSRHQFFQPVVPGSFYNFTNGFEGNSMISGNIPTVLQGSPLQDLGISCEANSVPDISCIFSNSGIYQSKVTPPLDTPAFSDTDSVYKTTRSSFERLSLKETQKCRSEDTKQEIPQTVNFSGDMFSRRIDAFSDDGADVTLLNLFSLDSLKECEDRTLFNFHRRVLLESEPSSFNETHTCHDNMFLAEAPSLQHSRLTTAYGIPVPEAHTFTGQPDLNANVFHTESLASPFGDYPAIEWTTVPGEPVKKPKTDTSAIAQTEVVATPPTLASVPKTRNETPPVSQESGFLFTPNDFPELPTPSLHSGPWQADRPISEPIITPVPGVPPSQVPSLGTYVQEMPSTAQDARLNHLRQSQSRRVIPEIQETGLTQQHRVLSPLRWYNPSYDRYRFTPHMKLSLHSNVLPSLKDDAYLSLFYMHVGLVTQLEAADQLYSNGWRYHKLLKMWMKRGNPSVTLGDCVALQNGSKNVEVPYYVAFDPHKWQQISPIFNVDERYFEGKPVIPNY